MKGDIQNIFQQFGDRFICENRVSLNGQHLKTIRNIQRCGTPEAGWIELKCADCESPRYIERSCGNRMCPSCQSGKTAEWLDKRLAGQLPTHYFLITFTVPKELHPFFINKPQEGLDALFKAGSEALKTLAGNPRFIGADLPGFFGVLHTWGRTLNFHPHVHFVVPGGGLDREKGLWRNSRRDFYAPGQALAKVFKGVFHKIMADKGLKPRIDPVVWRRKWVVDCEAVGQNREGIFKYLAPYVYKTAITDSRIVAVDNDKVTFSYVKSDSKRPRRMTLSVMEFIRRYLMHVLPAGFMRIRHYGFMGSGCSIQHDELVDLVRMAQGFEVESIEYAPAEKQRFPCPKCGGRLVAGRILTSAGITLAKFDRPRLQRE